MAHRTRPAAGNLTTAVTSFVGRRRELARVRECLATSRLVTLTGVGGVGKTRLALECGGYLVRAFSDGVWFVDLAPVSDPGLVAPSVVTALQLRDHSARPAGELLAEYLADRRTLILLDNCEHLLDACAAVVDVLLRSCPQLRILATSRQSLGITGEYVLTVPPLSTPIPSGSAAIVDPDQPGPDTGDPLPEHVDARGLLQYEAVNLLVERATVVTPTFQVTRDNALAVARLCTRLDGLPLAIELAATRLRTLSVEQLTERLTDRFQLLSAGSRVATPRQRTLRALIDWSYGLCTPEEKLLWARLSVFSGGFDLQAAETVCAGKGLAAHRILDLVDQLVAQSVIVRTDVDGSPRFGMLETIREYGWERLGELGEQDLLRQRHVEHFHTVARRSATLWSRPGQEAALARLRADHRNLQAAFDRCLLEATSPPRPGVSASTGVTVSPVSPAAPAELALSLAAALRWHWCADGFLGDGRRWLDLALSLAPARTSTGPDGASARAEALWVAAWVTLLQGDRDAAAERVTQCLRLSHELGDAAASAQATCQAGTASLFSGRLTEAIADYRRAVEALDRVADTAGVLHTLFQLAIALSLAGDHEGAQATAQRALALSEACGEHLGRSYALWACAFDGWTRGELAQARALALAALRLQRGFRDSVGTALMIETLAWIAASAADHLRAAGLLGTASSVWHSIGTSIGAFGPHLTEHHTRCELRVREALRSAVFRAAFAEGEQPTVEEAIGYALDEPSPSAAPAVTAPPTPAMDEVSLTPREREIAELVAEGLSNRSIAEQLVVSPRTVDGHVQKLLAKLGFTSRLQIATWLNDHRRREAPAGPGDRQGGGRRPRRASQP